MNPCFHKPVGGLHFSDRDWLSVPFCSVGAQQLFYRGAWQPALGHPGSGAAGFGAAASAVIRLWVR